MSLKCDICHSLINYSYFKLIVDWKQFDAFCEKRLMTKQDIKREMSENMIHNIICKKCHIDENYKKLKFYIIGYSEIILQDE
jgi:hypothetical protein